MVVDDGMQDIPVSSSSLSSASSESLGYSSIDTLFKMVAQKLKDKKGSLYHSKTYISSFLAAKTLASAIISFKKTPSVPRILRPSSIPIASKHDVEKVKYIFLVSLYSPTHNWHTIGLHHNFCTRKL